MQEKVAQNAGKIKKTNNQLALPFRLHLLFISDFSCPFLFFMQAVHVTVWPVYDSVNQFPDTDEVGQLFKTLFTTGTAQPQSA